MDIAYKTLEQDVLKVREFNRFHTKLVGALDEGLVTTDFSLVQMRVMYEIRRAQLQGDGLTASDLMALLQLDRGYLSRILTGLEKKGMLRKEADPAHGKRQILSFTEQGEITYEELESNVAGDVAELLAPLSEAVRGRLVRAMDYIQSVLGDEKREPSFILRDPDHGDLGWVVHRYGALFAQEQGYDQSFEGLVAGIVHEYVKNYDASCERGWIAEHAGEIAGSVFLVKGDEPGAAKLRLLYVEPSARGLGIGARLVDECVRFARAKGYHKITLWTLASQHSAAKIYRAKGFQLVHEDEPAEAFGQLVQNQTYELEL